MQKNLNRKFQKWTMTGYATLALVGCDHSQKKNSPAVMTSVVTPILGMTIGRGYDPTRPTEPKGDCLQNVDSATQTSWKDADGIAGAFSETRVTSWEQMQRELSVSANVAAESIWGNGNGSYSKFEKFQSDENSFTWLLKFSVETGQKTLNSAVLQLTPNAQALVSGGRLDEFYKMCGTEYVRSIKVGGRLLLAQEVSSKFSETVQSISAKVGGGANFGSWGFSGSASYASYFKDAFFKSILTREIEQIGGSSMNFDGLTPEKIADTLSAFQDQMKNNAQARVISVETASWDTIGVTGLNSFADWHRKEVLAELYSDYRYNLTLLARINNLFSWNADGKIALDDGLVANLNQKKGQLDSQQTTLASRASACLERASCDASGIDKITADLPSVGAVTSDVLQRFGRISFKIPEQISYYGSAANYDNKNMLYYDIPSSVLGDSGLRTARIFVYEQDCSSASAWLTEQQASLTQRGVATSPVVQVPGTQGTAFELNWQEGHLSKLVVFDKGASNACAVIKADASAGNLSSWNQLPQFSNVISRIKGSLSLQ